MYRTIFAAVSTDGFIADTCGKQDWVSNYDSKFLSGMLKNYDVLIMGRKTFEANVHKFKPNTKIRVVLTSNPKYYASKYSSDIAKFTNLNLGEVLNNYPTNNIAILGGTKIYTEAITNKLCDDAYITTEPTLIKSGTLFTKPVDLIYKNYIQSPKNDVPSYIKYFVKK